MTTTATTTIESTDTLLLLQAARDNVKFGTPAYEAINAAIRVHINTFTDGRFSTPFAKDCAVEALECALSSAIAATD